VRTGASREGGAGATEAERLEVAQSPALDRGEHATGAQEVFQAGQELLGARLVRRGKQFLGEPLRDGVRLAGLAGRGGMPLGLFLLEMAPMTPLAQAAGVDVVGTRRRRGTVFEAVQKGVEGPDRGRLEGGKARPSAPGADGCAGRRPTAGDFWSAAAAGGGRPAAHTRGRRGAGHGRSAPRVAATWGAQDRDRGAGARGRPHATLRARGGPYGAASGCAWRSAWYDTGHAIGP
jgi:hypothetical protein